MIRVGLTRATEERTAAGIYGVIVGAAVMTSSHADSAATVTVAVLFTLVIYWGAERYARLVAERVHTRHRPSWARVRQQLTAGWEVVSASAVPLAVLAILGGLGVRVDRAVFWALVCSTLLLCVAGWEMGRSGQLSGLERLVSAAFAGLFGVVFIALKALLH